MPQHIDWFSVDKEKRAARVRSYPLPFVLREALANALDAAATEIEVLFSAKEGTRSNREGNRAFNLRCKDNGRGCDDPEVLRRVGSSTSDLDPEKRGRFGQGLIDLLSICDEATILTKKNRLVFDGDGCVTSRVKTETAGLVLDASIRHGGEALDDLERYFSGLILPGNVRVAFNGIVVQHRKHIREILAIQLPTVVYQPSLQRMKMDTRKTSLCIYPKHGELPMIHELGIPVDAAPWELPYDIDVLQKTPLDMERCMLPAGYKEKVIAELVKPLSDLYEEFMNKEKRVPAEIQNDNAKAARLTESAKETAAVTMYDRPLSEIARRNPFDPQDGGRSQELETQGVLPLNTAHAPAGMREIVRDCATVKDLHDQRCRAHFQPGILPDVTDRQEACMAVYQEVASALLDRCVDLHRVSAPVRGDSCGIVACYSHGSIGLNIEAKQLWDEPLSAFSLGVIVHECAHEKIEGHAIEFQREIQRLAGKLAVWVGNNAEKWKEFKDRLKEGG